MSAVKLVAALTGIVWCVGVLNHTFGYSLNQFGIVPRDLETLPGILLWVLLHGDVMHLVLNTTPLLFMGFFVGLRGPGLFFRITFLVWILSGIAVWLLGRPGIHIGASGLVFGYFGFLLAVALYERSLTDLAVGSLTIFYYGGMFFGLLPVDAFVSWESHLAGLLSGVLAAKLYGKDWVRAQTS